MSPRAVLLAGVFLCACMLGWISGSGGAPPDPEGPMGGVVAASSDEPSDEPSEGDLVEIVGIPVAAELRVDALEVQRERQATRVGATTWSIRFNCYTTGLQGPLPRQLQVAIEGPGIAFFGEAHQFESKGEFMVSVAGTEAALEGASLAVATTKRALSFRDQSPFPWRAKLSHYRLGRAALATAQWDRNAQTLVIATIELLPFKFLGNVLLGDNVGGVKGLVIWTEPDPSRFRSLRWDANKGGNKLPFAAFVTGGLWGAGDRIPGERDELIMSQPGVPIGADVFLRDPMAVLELSLNLVSLPDTRSILIREAASGVPSALTMAEIHERGSALGSGVTTLSDRVVGRGQHKELPLGKTTLPSGEYAVEAWSAPNAAGLLRLVASKTVTLGVGTQKFTLQ